MSGKGDYDDEDENDNEDESVNFFDALKGFGDPNLFKNLSILIEITRFSSILLN